MTSQPVDPLRAAPEEKIRGIVHAGQLGRPFWSRRAASRTGTGWRGLSSLPRKQRRPTAAEARPERPERRRRSCATERRSSLWVMAPENVFLRKMEQNRLPD